MSEDVQRHELIRVWHEGMELLRRGGMFPLWPPEAPLPTSSHKLGEELSDLARRYAFDAVSDKKGWVEDCDRLIARMQQPGMCLPDSHWLMDGVISLVKIFGDDPQTMRLFQASLNIATCSPSAAAFDHLKQSMETTIGDMNYRTPQRAKLRQDNVRQVVEVISQHWPLLDHEARVFHERKAGWHWRPSGVH